MNQSPPFVRWQFFVALLTASAWLVAVITPRYNQQGPGPLAETKTQMAMFATALEAFKVDTGHFPLAAEGLGALIMPPPNATNWRGPYLRARVPLDPWGHAYSYECPGKHNRQSYDLSSMGPDGRAFNDDDIGNWPQK